MPENNPNDDIVQRTESVSTVEENVSNTEQENAVQDEQAEEDNTEETEAVAKKQKTLNISLPKPDDVSELEDINEGLPQEAVTANSEPSVQTAAEEVAPEEKAVRIFFASSKYKSEKQYVKALEELQKIPSITKDVNLIAKSYEETASIYAIVKRYGTALSYAQRAYNMSPSSSREMLLARLYYKTGDIDKATKRINNVLQRDFSDDR